METGMEPTIDGAVLSRHEKYVRAEQLEKAGQRKEAARLYGYAGYLGRAYKIYKELGDAGSAYALATTMDDWFMADQLAFTHKIANHEYQNFVPATSGFNESARITLESRLRPGATAERKLGFKGFQGKIVADIGTRDGRFVPLFRNLGAKEIYGIDPDKVQIDKIVKEHILDQEHAIPTTLQQIPSALKGKIEVGAIFNFSTPYTQVEDFFRAAYEALAEHGELIMTVAEDEVLGRILPSVRKFFSVESTQLFRCEEDFPHKNLVLCKKLERPTS